jgi:hypothetical protein
MRVHARNVIGCSDYSIEQEHREQTREIDDREAEQRHRRARIPIAIQTRREVNEARPEKQRGDQVDAPR